MTCLVHHGIKGQKWGVRRFQNDDGTLTPAGRERYNNSESKKKFAKAKSQMSAIYKERGQKLNRIQEESDRRVNARFKQELGMDPDEAYRKAAEQNDSLDNGELSYEDSIWKKINDIEDSEYYRDQIEQTKISDEYATKMASVGESFLDDYMDSKNLEFISYNEVAKLGNKEYNHEHQEWRPDSMVEQLFNVIDRGGQKYETVFVDEKGNATDDWVPGSKYGIRRKRKE